MLVKSCTLEAHFMFCYVSTQASHSCIDRFQKYWTWVHFKTEPHMYVIDMDSLTTDEIAMKKDLVTFYWNLGYEGV